MVHAFRQNGYAIALDVASGAVHVLSEVCYTLLQQLDPETREDMEPKCPAFLYAAMPDFSREEIDEAYADLYALYKDGVLFSRDMVISPAKRDIHVKAMCLHIAHDCNMRCRYCFAGTGAFHRARSLMPLEVGKRALDFLIARSGGVHNLEVDFFGGEPLMNFDVVKSLVLYGRELEKKHNKTIRFTITTNGALLDEENTAFINEHMYNVVLSIDGRREVNDKMRPYADGRGSYDDILPRYKRLVASRGDKDYYVRGTYTRANLDFASDVLHLADQGFDQVSVEPVVLPDDSPYSLREEELPAICAEYDRLADEMARRLRSGKDCFNFFHFMIDLDAGPCVYKRTKGCGSGSEYVAVTPDGDIYPCHQFVEHTEYKLGNVMDDTFDTSAQQTFAGCNIMTNENCSSCWAKYFCGGGCAANNYNHNHDIKLPYQMACALEKKRLECALMLKAVEADLS